MEHVGAWTRFTLTTAWVALIMALSYRLGSVPPLSFDEGWALTVAKNWVQRGEYMQLLDGRPVAPEMLNVGFPAVVPIALSFSVFGIGGWQARLPTVVFTLASLATLAALADRFFGHRVGRATPIVGSLLVLPVPFYIAGRQAWGETLCVMLLAVAYLCLVRFWRSVWLLIPSVSFLLSLAVATKVQALPFVGAALLIPLGVASWRRDRDAQIIFAAVTAAAAALYGSFCGLASVWLGNNLLHHLNPVYITQTALVSWGPVRVSALIRLLTSGFPGLVALAWTWHRLRSMDRCAPPWPITWPLMSLLILITTWTLWFGVLSVGWPRYLFPPMLLASPLLAGMLSHLTGDFHVLRSMREFILGLKTARLAWAPLTSLVASGLTILVASWTISKMPVAFAQADTAINDVAEFINVRAPAAARVETSESELLFLLDRSYHYPSVEVALQLSRRRYLGENTQIAYDPAAYGATLLVVGPTGHHTALYEESLRSGRYTLWRRFGPYELYQQKAVGYQPPD